MPRPSARFPLPAAALAPLAALALAGCGSNGIEGTIPADKAAQMQQLLTTIRTEVAGGDCTDAAANAETLKDQVDDLPATAGVELKTALRGAADHLALLAEDPAQCQQALAPESEPTTTSSTSSSTTTSSTTSTSTTSSTSSTEEPPPGHGGEPPGHGGEPPGHGDEGSGGSGGTGDTGG